MHIALTDLGSVFKPLERVFAIASKPAPKALPIRLQTEAARDLMDHVLEARDVADLRDRIEEVMTSEALWASSGSETSRAQAALESRDAPPKGGGLDMKSLERVLGATSANRCKAGYEALLAATVELTRLLAEHVATKKGVASPPTPASPKPGASRSIVDTLYDPSQPPAVRVVVVEMCRWTVVAWAISRAEERGNRLVPWLAMALADLFAQPTRRLLETIRVFKTFDALLAALTSRDPSHERFSAAIDEWRREAKDADEGVYFPLSRVDGSTR